MTTTPAAPRRMTRVEEQNLLRLGKAQLPGKPDVLDRGERGSARTDLRRKRYRKGVSGPSPAPEQRSCTAALAGFQLRGFERESD